jgi:DNA invertase Pin-like site-specific DNA recombinase
MSTNPQLLGDSRRRQLEASRAWAADNDLELAEGGELEDIGVSAFKGANATEGALGRFLGAVKSGAIKPGSFLLVESLDRLSRQQILPAQALFLSIIQAGINLVTLADRRVYRAGTADLGDLIVSLVLLSRAHEESLTKSFRHSATWTNKRVKAAAGIPMTKWCPAWLKLSQDRTEYIPIPERVDIVREIYADAVAGIGIYKIARRLNELKVPTFDSPNGWHQTYIAKILTNRAVLGEAQPHRREGNKRVPVGDPIRNHYPAIITEDEFYQAQFAKSQRRGTGAGRKGSAFTNLFSGLATCAYCRSPIKFENKGSGRKGGSYLICDGAKRGLDCPSLRWRYQDFEASFLTFVEDLDVMRIVEDSAGPGEREKIDAELAAIRGELSEVASLMEKLVEVLSGGGPIEFVTTKLIELEKRRTELNDRLAAKAAEQKELLTREARYITSKEEIAQLVGRLQDPETEDLYKLRAQIATQIKHLVTNIFVASIGDWPRLKRLYGQAKSSEKWTDEFAEMEATDAAAPEKRQRYFAVTVRGEDRPMRMVFPEENDPLAIKQHLLIPRVTHLVMSDENSA